MAPAPGKKEVNISTEEKIKEAARKVFTRKGYAGTRTRDIAEEAGINLALLNYYFRSKEKLFHQIMAEKMQELFGVLLPLVNDPGTALETKLELITGNYIDTISRNPDLPLFVLSEIRTNPGAFLQGFQVRKVLDSVLIHQLRERRPGLHPLHLVMNLLGLIVFPFVARPVFREAGAVDDEAFKKLMEERRKLVPLWIKSMLEAG